MMMMLMLMINMCVLSDVEVINLDTDDDEDDDDAGDISSGSCTSVAWDLSRAALQVEQMIETRYRTSPLGKPVFSLAVLILSVGERW